jgi:hypothetical protein
MYHANRFNEFPALILANCDSPHVEAYLRKAKSLGLEIAKCEDCGHALAIFDREAPRRQIGLLHVSLPGPNGSQNVNLELLDRDSPSVIHEICAWFDHHSYRE